MFRLLIIGTIVLSFMTTTLSAKTYKLVTGNGYAPFTDEKLPNRGMATEIVERVFQEMGNKTNIVFRPWKRAYMYTLKGKYEGVFPYVKTKERLKECYYSKPIYTIKTKFFVRSDSKLKKVSKKTMKGLKACSPLGYGIDKFKKYKLDVHINPHIEGCFKMLKIGRIEIIPLVETTGWATIKKTFGSKKGFKTLNKTLSREDLHFIVSKKNPEGKKIIKRFNKAFKKLQRNGTIRKIIRKHLK